jgi:SAM-dependent methyltransferase
MPGLRRFAPRRLHRRGLAALAAVALLALSATATAQEEVPFVTTPDSVTLAMLQLAEVGPADHVVDLGSGDGRIVITAARRFGASGLGVEIVPDLVLASRRHAQAAGVQDRVSFLAQDLFTTDLTRATVVTMYLLPEVNLQLRPRLLALAPGTRIVSHDWDLGDWTPDRTLTLEVPDKAIGRDKRSRVHLWRVPAAVHGVWCEPSGARLTVVQRFQQFSGSLERPGAPAPLVVFDGRIAGRATSATLPSGATLQWQAEAGGLRLQQASGAAADFAGRLFSPARDGRCN